MTLRQSIEEGFETALFASPWLMAPYYAGLVVALFVLLITFGKDLFECGSPRSPR